MTVASPEPSHLAVPATPPAPGPSGLAVLDEWVKAVSAAGQIVGPLVDSDFVPAAYKPAPKGSSPEALELARRTAIANGVAAVLWGMSLGLDPLTALQNIFIIYGRPGMYSKMKVALVQAKGHEVWTEELSATRVTVSGRRKGSDRIEQVTITIEDANTAGWTKNDQYRKVPADMLWNRAAGRVADRIGADVLMGIPTVDDLYDLPTEPQVGRVTAIDLGGIPEAPVARPSDVDDKERFELRTFSSADDDSAEPITRGQSVALHTVLGSMGLGNDRHKGLKIVSAYATESKTPSLLSSTNQLTSSQATRVITGLSRLRDNHTEEEIREEIRVITEELFPATVIDDEPADV